MANDGSINLGEVNGASSTDTPFAVSGAGEPGNLTDGDLTLPLLALEAAAADGMTLSAFTLSGTAETGGVGDGDVTLPFPTLDAGTAGVELPAFTLSAIGAAGALVTGDLTLPAFELAGALDGPLQLPELTLDATGESGGVGAGAIVLPAFDLAATSAPQADIALPAFDLSATGLAGAVGTGDAQLPAFTLDAAAYQDATADGDLTLLPFTLVATANGAVVADASITLPAFTLEAAALTGTVASADLQLPLYTLDAGGYYSAIGTADITLPAFVIAGANGQEGASGTSVPDTVVHTTVVVNTRLKGVTLYDGLEANSFAHFAGVTLAATANGIVALTGDTDRGEPIAAHMLAGTSTLGSEQFKQVMSAYVGYRAGGPLELTLITDEHHEYVYRLEPRQAAEDIHASRVKFGHGVKGRYWQWKLANVDGADFQLDTLRLMVQPLKRSV